MFLFFSKKKNKREQGKQVRVRYSSDKGRRNQLSHIFSCHVMSASALSRESLRERRLQLLLLHVLYSFQAPLTIRFSAVFNACNFALIGRLHGLTRQYSLDETRNIRETPEVNFFTNFFSLERLRI